MTIPHPYAAVNAPAHSNTLNDTVSSCGSDSEPQQAPTRYPLTHAQLRIWHAEQLGVPPGATSINALVMLDSEIPPEILQQAIRDEVTRRDAFQLRFCVTDGEPYQYLASCPDVLAPMIDLTHDPSARDTWCQRMARQPLNIEAHEYFTAHVLQTADGRSGVFLRMHHLIVDGAAANVLFNAIFDRCNALLKGHAKPLPPAPSFVARIESEQAYAQSARWERDRSYWLGRLCDFDTWPTLLPRDVGTYDFNGARYHHTLSEHASGRLRAFCASHRLSMLHLLAAAFCVYFAQLRGLRSLVLGTLYHDRSGDADWDTVGMYVSTVALRFDLGDNTTFAEMLGMAKREAMAALRRRKYPFDVLSRDLREYYPGIHEYIDIVLSPDNAAYPGEAHNYHGDTADFPMVVLATDRSQTGTLGFEIDYRTGLNTASEISDLLTRILHILEQGMATPDMSIWHLDPQTPEERTRQLDRSHGPRTSVPPEATLDACFDRSVREHPEQVAIRYGDSTLSYAEANHRVDNLCAWLRHAGVGPGVPVGIMLPRGMETPLAVLAILRAGGCCVPLDLNYPQERLRAMLAASQAPLVIALASLAEQLTALDTRVLTLESISSPAPSGDEPTPLHRSRDDAAYVLFTSGSTGDPKGVVMPHRALVNLIDWQCRNSRCSAGATTLQFAALSFDVSFQEMFATWATGGTLVVIDDATRRDFHQLAETIQREGINRIFLPFVALQNLAEAMASSATFPATLQEVITAGEQLQVTPALVRMFESLPGCTLENQYGPTESHVVSAHRLSGPPAHWPALPSIGTPIDNTDLYILSRERQLLPPGAEGELYIGGTCLATGYIHRPDLTAERFIQDPFSEAPSARLYRTGDLARWLPDGTLQFLGRADDQVKIRGFRVEPGEIENALARHPAVQQAVVIPRPDTGGALRLVAYIHGEDTPDASPERLTEFLLERLPRHLIPQAWVFVDAFPLTPSGKIARRQLPDPERTRASGSPEHVAPRNDAEQRMAKLWEALLERDSVGIHDDFFTLGGHSLLAARLFVWIEREFGKRLPVSALYASPTIAALAYLLTVPGDAPDESPYLLSMRTTNAEDATPLVIVHGGGGDLLAFRDLVAALPDAFPIYGLRAPEARDGPPYPDTVEAIAQRYVAALENQGLRGAIALGGYCVGGVIAWEIMQQLQQRGQQVTHLFMLDSVAPGYRLDLSGWGWRERLTLHRRHMQGLTPSQRRAYLRKRSSRRLDTMRFRIRQRLGRPPAPELLFMALEQHLMSIVARYQPKRATCPVTLIRSIRLARNGTLGWDDLLGDAHEVRTINIGHRDMLMAPHAGHLALLLRDRLLPGEPSP